MPRPPPSIIAGPPMPMRGALGRDDHVASTRPARCCRRKQRPLTTAIIGTRPDELREGGERLGVDRDARTDVVVAGPAAAAFAEQDQRQAEAVAELEDPVLLVVVAAALRARQHGVVVMHQRGARARLVEQVAVDRAHAGDDAVAGRVLAQRLHRMALVLARDDQRPVFLERAGIDQPRDVFARHLDRRSCAGAPPRRAGSRPSVSA